MKTKGHTELGRGNSKRIIQKKIIFPRTKQKVDKPNVFGIGMKQSQWLTRKKEILFLGGRHLKGKTTEITFEIPASSWIIQYLYNSKKKKFDAWEFKNIKLFSGNIWCLKEKSGSGCDTGRAPLAWNRGHRGRKKRGETVILCF